MRQCTTRVGSAQEGSSCPRWGSRWRPVVERQAEGEAGVRLPKAERALAGVAWMGGGGGRREAIPASRSPSNPASESRASAHEPPPPASACQ